MTESSARESMSIGIDIGGTFTDVVACTATGRHHAKVPSTRPDPSEAVTAALAAIFAEAGLPGVIASGHRRDQVVALAHGTTVATNAMIERNLSQVGLITTRGFRDVIAVGRQTRSTLYDVDFEPRWVPVPRHRRLEVSERMDASGQTLIAPDRNEVLAQAKTLVDDGVDAIAVAFLHAYVRDDHEQLVADWIRQAYPQVSVWTSAVAANEFREYERTCTVVLDAALGATMSDYLAKFAARARASGVAVAPTLMRSSGAVATVAEATSHPTWTLLSGPAAGVAGAVDVAERIGCGDLLTVDVGGTSADMALIRGGEAEVVPMRQVEGLPVLGTTLNIQAIGAGGGSIAWIDTGGRLRVGPRSAGAVPGPAAYGIGGTQATVTDAVVTAGMLPHDLSFGGGALKLDVDAARAAVERDVAIPLGMSIISAAHAILDVVNTNMALAARKVTVARGADPRQLTLVAYGGAGPMHAPAIATELAIGRVLIPAHPGTLCALGLQVSDLSSELVRSCFMPASQDFRDRFAATFDDLAGEAQAWAERVAAPSAEGGAGQVQAPGVSTKRFADVRYRGQEHALRVPVGQGPVGPATIVQMVADFHQLHRQINGFSAPDEPVELVNARLVVSKPATTLGRGTPGPSEAGCGDAVRDMPVWWTSGETTSTPVVQWHTIAEGTEVVGPAIVLQADATSIVPPGWRAVMQPDRAAMMLTAQQ